MSSTVIKNGTIVTADLSYAADVKIEGGVIVEIGKGLKGDTVLDATGCYVMPGGIDPHTHLEMTLNPARGRRCRAARRWWWISCCRGRGRG